MKKYLVLFLLLTIPFFNCSDDNPVEIKDDPVNLTPEDPNAPEIPVEWENWIKDNAHQIESITSDDYSDLQFFKPLLKEKTIVQLGESSHGVKEFNMSKVRLIKFLHEEMGFNVIAFESSLFNCYYGNKYLMNEQSSKLMSNTIYGVWHTYEVLELFDYIQQSQNTLNPLRLVGFDMKPSGIAYKKRPQYIHDAIAKLDPVQAQTILGIENYMVNNNLYSAENKSGFLSMKDIFFVEYQTALQLLEQNWDQFINEYSSEPEVPYIIKLTIESIISNLHFIESIQGVGSGNSTKIRDAQMAYNLEYLYKNVYPGEKFVVWAHNFHIRHNNASIRNTYATGVQSMGYYLYENLGNEIYTIGFYMYKGQVTSNNRGAITVTNSSSENIEAIFYRTRHHYSFVDMLNQTKNPGNSWMFENMLLKYWGSSDQTMIARDQYNGLYFVYETSVPDYVPYSSLSKRIEKIGVQ